MNIAAAWLEYGALAIKLDEAHDGRVMVAGGAVRDTVMGRPVKDLDILVDGDVDPEVFGAILGVGPLKLVEHTKEYENDDRTSQIVAVYKGLGVDVIQVDDADLYLREFPDDISKAYVDSEGVHLTEDFIQAHTNKVMRYRESAGEDRLARLVAKYPDYRVVHE